MITFIIVIFFLFFILSRGFIFDKDKVSYGVTFSKKQASDLGLEWKALYKNIFMDLGLRKIRLAAYWDEIEAVKDKYDFVDLDWQIDFAKKHNAKIILAVGGRLPRWPECHFPEWAKELDKNEREQETLDYVRKVVNRYKDIPVIEAWQVENEPFLPHFGECPKPDADFLDKEIALVRQLDDRSIVITDSGELSLWVPAARRADIFGTTMYRDTYSKALKAYVHYPIEPGFFRFKKNITKLFSDPQKWVVIELQAEPWGPEPFQNLSQAERDKTMNLEKFKDIIEFSRKTGFQEFYLWGVEWWYWEKTKLDNSALWDEARKLFK